MLQRMEGGSGNLLAFEAHGTVTDEEYRRLAEDVRSAVAEHGSVRLLARMPEQTSAEMSTLPEGMRLAKEHLGDIERYAVVTDRSAYEAAAKLADTFTRAEIRHFGLDEEDEAWEWVRSST